MRIKSCVKATSAAELISVYLHHVVMLLESLGGLGSFRKHQRIRIHLR
jgi:hypothetical protein